MKRFRRRLHHEIMPNTCKEPGCDRIATRVAMPYFVILGKTHYIPWMSSKICGSCAIELNATTHEAIAYMDSDDHVAQVDVILRGSKL